MFVKRRDGDFGWLFGAVNAFYLGFLKVSL